MSEIARDSIERFFPKMDARVEQIRWQEFVAGLPEVLAPAESGVYFYQRVGRDYLIAFSCGVLVGALVYETGTGVYRLKVNPAYRRQGIGLDLLRLGDEKFHIDFSKSPHSYAGFRLLQKYLAQKTLGGARN